MSGATTISIAAETMKTAGDCGRAPAGVPELERDEHCDDPEEERREHHHPERAEDERAADGLAESARRLRLGGHRRGPQRPDEQAEGESGDRGERRPRADRLRRRPDCRPEQRAEDGRADGGAQHLAAPLPRRAGDEPGQRPGPGERAPDALREPSDAELFGRAGEAERDARDCHQEEPRDHRAAGPEARRGDPAGDRTDERAERIGPDEEPCLALREPELVRVVRQQGHERRVQHRVGERDRADEEQEPAHRR